LNSNDRSGRFERTVLQHIDAAYRLARWLTHDDKDAEDVVQEACLRAWSFFDVLREGDCRPWFLKIVRNTFYTWLRHNRPNEPTLDFDEDIHGVDDHPVTPETLLLKDADSQMLRHALGSLPLESREVLILREFEGLSYKEIAEVVGIPIGTVMSRLSRARAGVQRCLAGWDRKEPS
jgi:RNA polymerase sigma-70 factor (ECF subfamily)